MLHPLSQSARAQACLGREVLPEGWLEMHSVLVVRRRVGDQIYCRTSCVTELVADVGGDVPQTTDM
jgi:hypothetical protein